MVGSAFKPEIMNVLSWIGFLKERVSSLVLSNDCDLLCGAITRVKVVLKFTKGLYNYSILIALEEFQDLDCGPITSQSLFQSHSCPQVF